MSSSQFNHPILTRSSHLSLLHSPPRPSCTPRQNLQYGPPNPLPAAIPRRQYPGWKKRMTKLLRYPLLLRKNHRIASGYRWSHRRTCPLRFSCRLQRRRRDQDLSRQRHHLLFGMQDQRRGPVTMMYVMHLPRVYHSKNPSSKAQKLKLYVNPIHL